MKGTVVPGLRAAKLPTDFLKSIRGRRAVVKLHSGVDYGGKNMFRPGGIYEEVEDE